MMATLKVPVWLRKLITIAMKFSKNSSPWREIQKEYNYFKTKLSCQFQLISTESILIKRKITGSNSVRSSKSCVDLDQWGSPRGFWRTREHLAKYRGEQGNMSLFFSWLLLWLKEPNWKMRNCELHRMPARSALKARIIQRSITKYVNSSYCFLRNIKNDSFFKSVTKSSLIKDKPGICSNKICLTALEGGYN